MNEQTKNTLIVGASVLIASTGLFLIGRAIVNRIKRKADDRREQLLEEEISGGGGSTQSQIEENTSTYNPSGDVTLISDYILGANLMYYPDEVNGIIMKLNNTDVKKLAEAWKKKYGRSLYYDLDDEWDACGTWGWDNCYESSMNRLSNLGLR
jgi:hypothetical protein